MDLFAPFPDDARLWVFTSDRPLSDEGVRSIARAMDDFVEQWTSHSRTVRGEAVVQHGRFLLVAAELPSGGDVSGCGIDSMVHTADEAASQAGTAWASALSVSYRDEVDDVQVVPRPAFRQKARAGEVDGQTHVFDTSLLSVGALREAGGLERPAAETWHGRVFRLAEAASAA